MTDESGRRERPIRGNRSAGDSSGERVRTIEALAAENRALRRRVAALEDAVDSIDAAFQRGATEAEDDGPAVEAPEGESDRKLLPSGGRTVKVLGKLGADDGVGVLGHATSGSGTTYGVRGEVDSTDGYGLYTPDDAGVGALEVDRDGTVQRTAGPVAKGWVKDDGTLAHGVNVDTVTWVSQHDWYEIELADDVYTAESFVTTFDSTSGVQFESGSGGVAGDALLAIPADGSTHPFGFVTHRLTPD